MPRFLYMELTEPESIFYTITVVTVGPGTVIPSTSSYPPGGSQVFSFTPNTNYQVNAVLVNGTSVGNPSSYTFNNIQSTYTLQVVFGAQGHIGSWLSGTEQTFWRYR